MKPMLKGREVEDCSIAGIDHSDYPKYCDAYIESAIWSHSGKSLTDDELEELNENQELVYELTINWIY